MVIAEHVLLVSLGLALMACWLLSLYIAHLEGRYHERVRFERRWFAALDRRTQARTEPSGPHHYEAVRQDR